MKRDRAVLGLLLLRGGHADLRRCALPRRQPSRVTTSLLRPLEDPLPLGGYQQREGGGSGPGQPEPAAFGLSQATGERESNPVPVGQA